MAREDVRAWLRANFAERFGQTLHEIKGRMQWVNKEGRALVAGESVEYEFPNGDTTTVTVLTNMPPGARSEVEYVMWRERKLPDDHFFVEDRPNLKRKVRITEHLPDTALAEIIEPVMPAAQTMALPAAVGGQAAVADTIGRLDPMVMDAVVARLEQHAPKIAAIFRNKSQQLTATQ